jgi:hypothetical protein
MSIKLTFKADTTSNGNAVKVATINATLLRLSDTEFSYSNADGETIKYKLADVKFTDNAGVQHKKNALVVYQASYEQGMEVGETYLGRVQLSEGRKPWATLSSYVSGDTFSEADFEDVAVEDAVDAINIQ